MTLRVLSVAELEAAESALWYEGRQPGLGGAFLAMLEETYRRIEERPFQFPVVELDLPRESIRRAAMTKFPFQVIYEVVADEAVVIAVAHNSREPGYWTGRA